MDNPAALLAAAVLSLAVAIWFEDRTARLLATAAAVVLAVAAFLIAI